MLKDEGYNTTLLEKEIAEIENELLLEAYGNQINQVNKMKKIIFRRNVFIIKKY